MPRFAGVRVRELPTRYTVTKQWKNARWCELCNLDMFVWTKIILPPL